MADKSETRVAAIQLSCSADLAHNKGTIDALLCDAADRGVSLALLPENSVFIGVNDEDKIALAEDEGEGPIQSFLAEQARKHGLWLIAGSIPLKSPSVDRCFGASVAWDDQGELVAAYRKIHLFDVDLPERDESYRESATMAAGAKPVTIDTPAGRLGLTICYDLRFPELYRQLVDDGATVFTVPAAFTAATGRAHWRSLLRARAIENLAYVIAAGQYGQHDNGRRTHGHSMIIDPWGRVIAEQPEGDAVVDAVIDVDLPSQLRREFPALESRRL